MSLAIGLVGLDSSHAEDFIRLVNIERRRPDLRIAALHGDDRRTAELTELDRSLARCNTLTELIDSVDAVIVGHRNGALHREPAIACLNAQRAVFVDKPLANSRTDAEMIVAAAERTGTPLLSGSALRWQAEAQRVKARLSGIDGPIALHAWGTWHPESEYGGPIFYAIHTVELALELLGTNFRKVKLRAAPEPTIMYRAGESDVTLTFHPPGGSGQSEFGVEVRAGDIHFRQPLPLGDDYMLPVVDRIAAMLHTRAAPMAADDFIAPLALMDEIARLLPVHA